MQTSLLDSFGVGICGTPDADQAIRIQLPVKPTHLPEIRCRVWRAASLGRCVMSLKPGAGEHGCGCSELHTPP